MSAWLKADNRKAGKVRPSDYLTKYRIIGVAARTRHKAKRVIMNSIDCVLFDLDGTISESAPGIARSVQYGLKRVGIDEPDLKKLETFVGPPLNVTFREMYGLDEQQILEAVMAFRELYQKDGIFDCRPYPGILQMLRACRARGLKLGVASSKPEQFVVQIIEHFGMADLFDAVCGSSMDEEQNSKAGLDSKQLVIAKALDILQAKTSRCAMVGDRCYDMDGAVRNGLLPVGVTFGYGSRQELEEAGAVYIADTADELEKYLCGLHD